jgi:hypothetical protein
MIFPCTMSVRHEYNRDIHTVLQCSNPVCCLYLSTLTPLSLSLLHAVSHLFTVFQVFVITELDVSIAASIRLSDCIEATVYVFDASSSCCITCFILQDEIY